MADPNRLAGICTLTIDGQSYMLEGSAKYKLSTVKRETLTGQDAVHGFKETPEPGMMSFSVRDSQDLSVDSFTGFTASTVVFVLASGKTIVGSKMWLVDAVEVDTVDAKMEIKFEGRDGSVSEQ